MSVSFKPIDIILSRPMFQADCWKRCYNQATRNLLVEKEYDKSFFSVELQEIVATEELVSAVLFVMWFEDNKPFCHKRAATERVCWIRSELLDKKILSKMVLKPTHQIFMESEDELSVERILFPGAGLWCSVHTGQCQDTLVEEEFLKLGPISEAYLKMS